MDLEELKAQLKAEHSIDLDELTKTAEAGSAPAEPTPEQVTAAARDLLESVLSGESEEEGSAVGELVAAELSKRDSAIDLLKGQVENLQLSATGQEVDALIAEGRVLPAQRDAMIQLANSDRELFSKVVPDKPVVKLSAGKGVETADQETELGNLTEEQAQAEIARLTNDNPGMFGLAKKEA